MWKIILCGSVIVVASTSVPGQSAINGPGQGSRQASPEDGEMLVAVAAARPGPVVRMRYDSLRAAHMRTACKSTCEARLTAARAASSNPATKNEGPAVAA